MTTSLQDHRYLSCESFDDILVVKPAADPRNFTYEVKQHEYNSVMQSIRLTPGQSLLIDLTRCELLDSVTVGIFIQLSREVIRVGGRTAMCGASTAIRETLARLMLLEPTHRKLAWRQFVTAIDGMAELNSSPAG